MISAVKVAFIAAAVLVSTNTAWAQEERLRTVHVFVALADNDHQGIVPVARILGNGEDPEHNLYWGSAYGVKAFFSHSPGWTRLGCAQKPKPAVLERCIFVYKKAAVFLIADAYRGMEIKQAIFDFLDSAAGRGAESITPQIPNFGPLRALPIYGGASLVAYVGHDGLMDFQLPRYPQQKNATHRDAIILACASKRLPERIKSRCATALQPRTTSIRSAG